MQKATTREYIVCPSCNGSLGDKERIPVDIGDDFCLSCFGCWSEYKVYYDDCGNILLSECDIRIKEANLLYTVINGDPTFCVVISRSLGKMGGNRSDEEIWDGKRYFYEDGQCPTNFLGDIFEVISFDPQDKKFYTDPHGLFKYIKTVDLPEDFDFRGCDYMAEDFAKLFSFDFHSIFCDNKEVILVEKVQD